MTNIMEDIFNFIFPPHCPECDAYVENQGEWCENCLGKRLQVHRLPLDIDMAKVIDGAWALGMYDGALKKLIRGLKFQKKRENLPAIHKFLDSAKLMLPTEILTADTITAVPLHWEKEKERGFNQAELIFSSYYIGDKNSGILPYGKLLNRTKMTVPQFELSAAERRKNLKGAFSVSDKNLIVGQKIVLVDDIMTTGTTFFECATALKKCGAATVYALVLASDR